MPGESEVTAAVVATIGVPKARIAQLLHINVEVTDLERALRFYRMLGLDEIERAGSPGRAGAWFRFGDGRELHLSMGVPQPDRRAHFAVLVGDLAALRRDIEALGIRIETERDIPGILRFFARDPDGNLIGGNSTLEQARQVFRNIEEALGLVGASMKDVVKVVAYFTPGAVFSEYAQARREFLEPLTFIGTGVTVTALIDPDMLLEVEAVAVIGS